MKCPKCNAEMPEGAKFCFECGKKMPAPKPPQPEVKEIPTIVPVDPILKPIEAARLLKVSRWKMDELRIQKKIPPSCYFEIPSRGEGIKCTYRYRAKELIAWVDTLTGPITTAG